MRHFSLRLQPLLALLLVGFSSFALATDPILLFGRNVTQKGSHDPHLSLTPKGETFLRSLPSDFAIISVVGPTRTGKSLLMNNFVRAHQTALSSYSNDRPSFGNDNKPFVVSKGVTSATQGLWIWPEPIRLNGKDTYLVDVEGLHGVESVQSSAYEVELFIAACMISSNVLYNTWYPVHAEDVRTLKRLAAFSRLFMMDAAAATETITDPIPDDLSPPNLHWTIQNFNKYSLQLQGWTPAEFLDQIIRKDSLLKDANVDYKFVKQQFGSLKMMPISRPLDDDAKMAGMNGAVSWNDWNKEYRNDILSLVSSVASNHDSKRLNSAPIAGSVLADLIKRWFENAPIQIPERTSWDSAVELKLDHERKHLLEIFDRQVSQLLPPDPRTITYDAFIDNLDSKVKKISEAMRISAARVGQEPEQSAGVVLLGKQLADKKSLYIERYVDWARSHVATLGRPATTVIIRSLRTLLASDEDLCMMSKSALRKEMDTLVESALAPALETARRILPRSDDPRSLILNVKYNREATSKEVRDATSGAIIENLRRRISHRRAQCPSPLEPLYDFIRTHYGKLLATGAAIASALFLHHDSKRNYRQCRNALIWLKVEARVAVLWLRPRIRRAFDVLTTSIVGVYLLYFAVQYWILGRTVGEMYLLIWRDQRIVDFMGGLLVAVVCLGLLAVVGVVVERFESVRHPIPPSPPRVKVNCVIL
ncbi:guanylate-binding protein [Fimicolochytrium jonesii]|uniref:guanylate-binding protein n=1 Tax=Fimicolochytrium jonesii TaxID=1396493 RepID=UPI0022FDD949|nr:guanylate-binding protein [Fimicolochytrium jonesii]KAI8817012.1 guanylate-binding protein [Fimicolochytrium jonesii]